MQLYVISFMRLYKQSSSWRYVLDMLVLITQLYHTARFRNVMYLERYI